MTISLPSSDHPQPCTEGFGFLGFTVFPNRRRLKRRKGVHFQRKLKRMAAAVATGDVPFANLRASIRGWVNHVRYANTVGLRKAVLRKAGVKRLYRAAHSATVSAVAVGETWSAVLS